MWPKGSLHDLPPPSKKPRLEWGDDTWQTGDEQGKWGPSHDAGSTELTGHGGSSHPQEADAPSLQDTEEAVAGEDDDRAPAGENYADPESDEWQECSHKQWMEERMRWVERLVWMIFHQLEQTDILLKEVAGAISRFGQVLLDVQKFLYDSVVLPPQSLVLPPPPPEAGSVADTAAAAWRRHQWTAAEWRGWLG